MSANNDLVYSLARACARGHRQLSFVNELLSWKPVTAYTTPVPAAPRSLTMTYGVSELQHARWVNLRKRLVTAGFVVSKQYIVDQKIQWAPVRHATQKITLDHPARH